MHLYFDIETDGLLEEVVQKDGTRMPPVSRIWCIEAVDLDTGERHSFADQPGYRSIKEGLEFMTTADSLSGHNIIKYDLKVIEKLYPEYASRLPVQLLIGPNIAVWDTLTISRLIWPEIKQQIDFPLIRKGTIRSGSWMGKHALEAWGIRLGCPKDDYSERCKAKGINPWGQWSKEMQDYCYQDNLTGIALWRKIQEKNPDRRAVDIEQEFQEVIFLQEQNGYWFNEKEAVRLYAELSAKRDALASQLKARFGCWYAPEKEGKVFVPKANNARLHYIKDCPCTKIKLVEFNPGSREQIARVLKKTYGWEPTEFSEKTGEPTVSETVLEKLEYPEAKPLNEFLLYSKTLGMLAEGDKAWLKLVEGGHIHGTVITNGAVTGRCTHRNPNVAQVPKVGSPFGAECRALFGPPPGWVQLGCDASGLELRMLGHYMARYDKGAYAKVILEGDIHTVNQQAAGLPTRDGAKTFIYAFLYGAGPVKLGSIVKPLASEEEQRKIGLALMSSFLKKTPALKKLREEVKRIVDERGSLKAIDGRVLRIRSSHSALNTLFQSAGAIVVKRATILLHQKMREAGYVYGYPDGDWVQMAHVHDEFQLGLNPKVDAQAVGQIAVESIREAGVYFNFRLPLDGEFKVGRNWAETH